MMKKSLINLIKEHFSTKEPPSIDMLTQSYCSDPVEQDEKDIINHIAGKKWTKVRDIDLSEVYGLSFFSKEAAVYYLPRFLQRMIENYEDCDEFSCKKTFLF